MQTRVLAVVTVLVTVACADPTNPAARGAFTAMTGGIEHTCALVEEGAAYCWGRNTSFELGTGRVQARQLLPAPVAGLVLFSTIDAGDQHTCGIIPGGDAYCWGLGSNGELGSDTATTTRTPIPVAGGLKFRAITLGDRHTCALTNGGIAYCWGDNTLGQVGRDTAVARVQTPVPVAGGHTFIAIAAGDYHTCGIAADGLAYCWGSNAFGALGASDTIALSKLPVAVSGGHHFRAIDGGNVHTCAVATNGEAWCWGAGGDGQLGNGQRTDQFTPVRVSGTVLFGSITVGVSHSCAGDIDAVNVYCWGSNAGGQLAGQANEMCAFGPNDSFPCRSTPARSGAPHQFVSISAGGFHTCAIESGGAAYCWGANTQGQLGSGGVGDAATPVRVPDPPPALP